MSDPRQRLDNPSHRALAAPPIHPAVLARPRELSGFGPVSRHPPEDRRLTPRTPTERLISQLPKIARRAGYPLYGRLIDMWLRSPRASQRLELPWTDVEQADEAKILARHLDAARKVVGFSMVSSKAQATAPSLSGFRVEIRQRLLQQVGLLRAGSTSPRTLRIEVLKIPIDAKFARVNRVLVERLKQTRKTLRSGGDPVLIGDFEQTLKEIESFNDAKRETQAPIEEGQAWTGSLTSSGIRVRWNQLAAALGRFNLYVTLVIRVTQEGWSVTSTEYRVEDLFDFEDEQFLGVWTVNGFEIGPGNIVLFNSDFRRFSEKFGLGGSFHIESLTSEATQYGPFPIPKAQPRP